MDPFYCLIHTPEAITPEICVLAAADETLALKELDDIARDWPRLERLELYQGNRRIRAFVADYARGDVRRAIAA
ncbi:hypothetical protein D3C85_983390 [compost metagenome]